MLFVTLSQSLCVMCVLFSVFQYVPPDLCICSFVLEQSLSVRALQEMLAKTGQNNDVRTNSHQQSEAMLLCYAGIL